MHIHITSSIFVLVSAPLRHVAAHVAQTPRVRRYLLVAAHFRCSSQVRALGRRPIGCTPITVRLGRRLARCQNKTAACSPCRPGRRIPIRLRAATRICICPASAGIVTFSFSFFRKSWQSFQDTCSTGKRDVSIPASDIILAARLAWRTNSGCSPSPLPTAPASPGTSPARSPSS